MLYNLNYLNFCIVYFFCFFFLHLCHLFTIFNFKIYNILFRFPFHIHFMFLFFPNSFFFLLYVSFIILIC